MAINLFIPDSPPTVEDRRERSHLLRLRSAAFWSLRFVLMHFHPSAFFLFSQLALTSFSLLPILRKQTLHYTFGDFVRRRWQFHKASRNLHLSVLRPVLSKRLQIFTGFAAVPVRRRASGIVFSVKCCGRSVQVCSRKQQWHREHRVSGHC